MRRLRAFHEAGHAVVASAIGRRVVRVWIDETGDQNSGAEIERVEKVTPDLDQLALTLAGGEAERLAGVEAPMEYLIHASSGDGARLYNELDVLAPDDDDAKDIWLRKACEHTETLVARHKDTVVRVAEALIEKGELTSAEFYALVVVP